MSKSSLHRFFDIIITKPRNPLKKKQQKTIHSCAAGQLCVCTFWMAYNCNLFHRRLVMWNYKSIHHAMRIRMQVERPAAHPKSRRGKTKTRASASVGVFTLYLVVMHNQSAPLAWHTRKQTAWKTTIVSFLPLWSPCIILKWTQLKWKLSSLVTCVCCSSLLYIIGRTVNIRGPRQEDFTRHFP